jgi:hypothetical protein
MISANLVESNNTGFQTNQFSNKPVFRTNQIFKQTSFSNGTSFQKNAPVGFGLACRVGFALVVASARSPAHVRAERLSHSNKVV